VTPFDRLHPALQHHVVNSLGWTDLRPFQQAVIDPVLAGKHLLVLAPTAGGKTEAAFFPVLSRMLTEGWRGLSVLYVCPIRALLNNLDARLTRYCTLLGRRSGLWHGDIAAGRKKAALRDPPDCLLTTPESLEVMLVSPRIDARALFAGLRVVIVDEVHAFAGDDRGWHLLAVLSRIGRLCGREFQRIGLSATVGNPAELLDWLAGTCEGPRQVCHPSETAPAVAEVRLDYVGSLHNAAVVISRLHRGEKRLAFVDSRARAEQLARELRSLEATTFVTHSSLSQEERRQAEEAFAARDDCVIVATSVLELGIDVGDLHRVIQVDAPATVSSFLQRMGRTGRRPGASRNCLFLATDDDALLRAAGLIELWSGGYVEPVVPPAEPYHILAQQLMALCLQERGVGRRDWPAWLRAVPAFSAMPAERVHEVLDWMLAEGVLSEAEGILWLGQQGEEAFGRKNFLELFSVFTSPPLFVVRHGRQELGFVDQTTFLSRRDDGPRVLLLGGRAWRVTHLDWGRKVAHVEATEETGRSRWRGTGLTLRFPLCQAVRQVLAGEEDSPRWSRRAQARLAELRQEHSWVHADGPSLLSRPTNGVEWWTFAGTRANATLAGELSRRCGGRVDHDAFVITIEAAEGGTAAEQAVRQLAGADASSMEPQIEEAALEGLKFSECLPKDVALATLASRLRDAMAIRAVLSQPLRVVSGV
jgi:ATP-dependent Lhr-like helicase